MSYTELEHELYQMNLEFTIHEYTSRSAAVRDQLSRL